MGLQMGGIDHQPFGLATLGRQFGENPVEHTKTAPADETVVDCLVRAILLRRVAPAKSVPDHKDHPAEYPAVIDTRHAVRQRKIRLNPTHLRSRKPIQITHGDTSGATNESALSLIH